MQAAAAATAKPAEESIAPLSQAGVVASEVAPLRLPPGAENAGKPGYYTVKAGDSLIRVAYENGQSWKDIARWNALENPNLLEVGQVIRVIKPDPVKPGALRASTAAALPSATVATTPVVAPTPPMPAPAATPLANANVAGAPALASGVVASTASGLTSGAAVVDAAVGAAADHKTVSTTPAVPVVPPPKPATPAKSGNDEAIQFIWPSTGAVAAEFDKQKNKGVSLSGKAGDPVLAAADGRVVYAGSSLRGYGNLIILKHSSGFLTAYAHNQTLLVKEDQTVRQGQKIAEMGSSDADRVKLHFEVRRNGDPVDPLKWLPPR
jgi:lipoprotein NlpD